MNDHSLRTVVAIRLGTSVCAEHRRVCGSMVAVNDIHGLGCSNSKGRLARHVTMPSMSSSNAHCWQPKFRLILSRPNCHTLTINDQMVCQPCRGHVDSIWRRTSLVLYNSEVNQLKLWGIDKRIAPCFGPRFQRWAGSWQGLPRVYQSHSLRLCQLVALNTSTLGKLSVQHLI
jgi:hypothetical protein